MIGTGFSGSAHVDALSRLRDVEVIGVLASSPDRSAEAAEAYLRSAVLNRCRSWVRRRVTEAAPRPLLVLGPQDGPEDAAVEREEVGSLVAALRTLARRQREVLACRYVLGLSVLETADLLGISEGSVKTHAHRGLQSLNERIEVTR